MDLFKDDEATILTGYLSIITQESKRSHIDKQYIFNKFVHLNTTFVVTYLHKCTWFLTIQYNLNLRQSGTAWSPHFLRLLVQIRVPKVTSAIQ